ncbi:MAG: cytochrome c-type biogenesis protein CcmE [Cellvibrionaceae bacterium]|jgi:cytochrome c-type biogenesis protein CcmE
MANSTWTKTDKDILNPAPRQKWQFVLAAAVLLAAVIFVAFNALNAGGTQLYLTVDEYLAKEAELSDRDVRIAGWVIGDSIEYVQIDAENSTLTFDVVDDLQNPTHRLTIYAENEPKPDLLQHEAQALVEGSAGDPGVFNSNAGGLLLKCPTRYEETETELEAEASG